MFAEADTLLAVVVGMQGFEEVDVAVVVAGALNELEIRFDKRQLINMCEILLFCIFLASTD